MPVIQFYGPKMAKDKKEQLVREMSDVASRATGIPADRMIVYVFEMDPENVGVGGTLLVDRKP